MRRWFVLTAIGRDRPGLVAELARLIYDSDANLEDSRMTILGTDFAVILLCSGTHEGCGDRLAMGAKQLERDHGLTILLRHLEGGPRSAVPGPGHRLYRVEAAGEDRAGIVAGICGILAEHGVNIADLASRSRPGPGGSPRRAPPARRARVRGRPARDRRRADARGLSPGARSSRVSLSAAPDANSVAGGAAPSASRRSPPRTGT
jgi:glycine cleavage system transcriptional repressor